MSNTPTSTPEHTFKLALDTSEAASGAGKQAAPSPSETEAEKRRSETGKAAADGERLAPKGSGNAQGQSSKV